jgi:hypothetical protein
LLSLPLLFLEILIPTRSIHVMKDPFIFDKEPVWIDLFDFFFIY